MGGQKRKIAVGGQKRKIAVGGQKRKIAVGGQKCKIVVVGQISRFKLVQKKIIIFMHQVLYDNCQWTLIGYDLISFRFFYVRDFL